VRRGYEKPKLVEFKDKCGRPQIIGRKAKEGEEEYLYLQKNNVFQI
jgi:hypothetical protein